MAKSAQPELFATGPVIVDGIQYFAADGIDINLVLASATFTDWLNEVDRKGFDINWILFQSVDMFGPPESARVGFLKFKAEVFDGQGKALPGIVFARGGSVAVLAVLECEGEEHVVLTVQPRLSTGRFDFVEVCAGMLDGSGNFVGVVAKEIKEELGIEVQRAELVDLTALSGIDGGIYMSPGGCPETIRFFAFRRSVSRAELDSMNGRCTGELAEGEQIVLKIVKLHELLKLNDAKSQLALTFYLRFQSQVMEAQAAYAALRDGAA